MNTRKTVELKALNHSIYGNSDGTRKDTATVEIRKPECKNGVCSLNWKPVRPTAAA